MFAVPDNTLVVAENPALRHPVRVALEFAADRDRWRHLLRYDPDQRFSALIDSDERQEVWLMAWLPGQHTDLHDHALSSGAFTIVSGSLTESVARRAPDGRSVTELHALVAGQSRVFGPGYVHEVRNDGPDTAVSVHVYRGGREMRGYRLDALDGPVRI
jgi:predicted metal-dependent enzyme (double-stranded beta helix superfamily)